MITVEDHVHALEDETVIVILERQDAFAAQDVRSLGLDQVLNPREKLVRIERLVAFQRNRLHLLVVIVLEPAMTGRMAVMVIVAVLVPVVMVVLVVLGKEFGLDVEDAVEIKGVTAQDLVQWNLCAFGPVHLGVGIDAPNARFDVA